MTSHYILEKIEAYNLAINALIHHEPASEEVNPEEASKIRLNLAKKLDKECQRWYAKVANENPNL